MQCTRFLAENLQSVVLPSLAWGVHVLSSSVPGFPVVVHRDIKAGNVMV